MPFFLIWNCIFIASVRNKPLWETRQRERTHCLAHGNLKFLTSRTHRFYLYPYVMIIKSTCFIQFRMFVHSNENTFMHSDSAGAVVFHTVICTNLGLAKSTNKYHNFLDTSTQSNTHTEYFVRWVRLNFLLLVLMSVDKFCANRIVLLLLCDVF